MSFTKSIREQAHGHWDIILRELAPEIDEALDRPGRHTACPIHGGKDGFRLYPNFAERGGGVCNTCGPARNGLEMLVWLKGWNFQEAAREVQASLKGEANVVAAPQVRAAKPKAKKKRYGPKYRQLLRSIWQQAVPLDSYEARLGQLYLRSRLLGLPRPSAVRFHPELVTYDGSGNRITLPGLVAKVVDPDGVPVTLHRTFLDEEGNKADIETPRACMPVPDDRELAGGAIRLSTPNVVLGVAEGYETAEAVARATHLPTWSTLNSTLLKQFVPPEGVQYVAIWADKDRSRGGQEAAEMLRERLWGEGYHVGIYLPHGRIPDDSKSLDWNDVLMTRGIEGFPALRPQKMVA